MKTLALCLNKVIKEGYTEDFKVSDNALTSLSDNTKYDPEQVHVVNFFRFEGNSDPADNSILYVIETSDGKKGTLVDAYGPYAEEKVNKFMKQVEDVQKKVAAES